MESGSLQPNCSVDTGMFFSISFFIIENIDITLNLSPSFIYVSLYTTFKSNCTCIMLTVTTVITIGCPLMPQIQKQGAVNQRG